MFEKHERKRENEECMIKMYLPYLRLNNWGVMDIIGIILMFRLINKNFN